MQSVYLLSVWCYEKVHGAVRVSKSVADLTQGYAKLAEGKQIYLSTYGQGGSKSPVVQRLVHLVRGVQDFGLDPKIKL